MVLSYGYLMVMLWLSFGEGPTTIRKWGVNGVEKDCKNVPFDRGNIEGISKFCRG